MNTKIPEKLIVDNNMSIKDAMHIIDEGGCKTAFFLEDGKLKGTITDGDVRRYFLKGGSIEDKADKIANHDPKFFYDWEKKDYKKYMIENMITALPIINNDGQLVRIEMLSESEFAVCKIDKTVPIVMMAGGLGTRLKPYTEIIPKPLIPIGEKTITEHIFDRFLLYGCDELYMIVNYKKQLIEAYFNDIEKYKNLSFIEEPFFMGTAGGISLLKDCLNADFFLINCDVLIDFDYYSIWKRHVEEKNIVTIVSAEKRIVIPYGTVSIGENETVCSLIEKPEIKYNVNTGMYLCNSKIYKYIDKNEKIDMPDLIKRCLHAGERIGNVLINEQDWYDMGQPKELKNMLNKFVNY